MSVKRARLKQTLAGLTLLLSACGEGEPQTVDLFRRDSGTSGPDLEVPIGSNDAGARGDASANQTSDASRVPGANDGGVASDARTSDAQASIGDVNDLDPGSRDAQVGNRDAASDGDAQVTNDSGAPPGTGDGGDLPPPDGSTPPPPDGSMPPPPDGGGMQPPPEGGMPPPEGGMPPPEGGMPPPEGGMPPPEGGMPPPEGGMPPPDGGRPPGDGSMPPPDGGQPPRDGGPLDGGPAPVDAGSVVDATPVDGGSCTLTANTSTTGLVNENGCNLLTRDTSACTAARVAAGLSGFWLKFSCRVSLTVSDATQVVIATADSQPDYKSFYFLDAHACYEAYPEGEQNPSRLSAKSLTLQFPRSPNTTQSQQTGAIVGLALNGVGIFGAYAAPGDDIYEEADTFDRCGAHPQGQGTYHYHSEPYSISYKDSNFIGVMRDGHPIYGRYCNGSTEAPTNLDSYGGHTSATVDSATAVYHYHVNEQQQTDPSLPKTYLEKQWFITKGRSYRGTAGSCTGCN